MGRRTRLAVVVPAAVAVLGLATVPAVAAPAEPAKPQAGEATGEPLGHAIGNAGTLLAAVRALPGMAGLPPLVPGLPTTGKGLLSLGVGLSSAKTNSEASSPKTAAEAALLGLSLLGSTPALPGRVTQTAPPDHTTPTTSGIDIPDNPLLTGSLLKTSALARWSNKLGPCVGGPIGEGKSSTADLNILPNIPRLDAVKGITSVPDVTKLLDVTSQLKQQKESDLAGPAAALFNMLGGVPGLPKLPGLPNLPGLPGVPGGPGTGTALVSLPGTVSTQSTVKLVPMKGSKNKAVQSVSKYRVVSLRLFSGTPFELRVDVIADPTLRVTSTGSKATSTVSYSTPILKIYQGGVLKYTLDASNPTAELPLALLPIGSLPGQLAPAKAANVLNQAPALADALGVGKTKGAKGTIDAADLGYSKELGGNLTGNLTGNLVGQKKLTALPVIGALPGLPNISGFDLNLGLVRLSIAHKEDTGVTKTKPFKGFEIGSTARLLNVEVLPAGGLDQAMLPKLPGVPDLGAPLAQVAVGEQTAKAYAPKGGVVCAPNKPAPPYQPKPPAGQPRPPLAYTDAAYQAVPIMWTGAGLVLAGAALLGIRPLRRKIAKHRS
jgi:hypothetical protein